MPTNFKTASILLEVILSIFIMSMVTISALYIYKNFAHLHHTTYENELRKIEWLNTKYFLQKNLISQQQLHYSHQDLYFNHHLLLSDVSDFSLKQHNNQFIIYVCLKNSLCNTMVIHP